MRWSILAVLGLLSLSACSSGRIVVASSDPTPPPPPPHTVRGPVASLGVPPGHYPPPGACRVWIPGRPPGRQPRPCPCGKLVGDVPLGAWVLYRPVDDAKILEVTKYHAARRSEVLSVSWYDTKSGELVRAKRGGEDGQHGHHGKSGESEKSKSGKNDKKKG